jgi:hypothetical protein
MYQYYSSSHIWYTIIPIPELVAFNRKPYTGETGTITTNPDAFQ